MSKEKARGPQMRPEQQRRAKVSKDEPREVQMSLEDSRRAKMSQDEAMVNIDQHR